jgi:hypothetical protein
MVFNPTLNATRFVDPDGVEEIDVGSKDDCRGEKITPANFLGLLGVQLRPADPYEQLRLEPAAVDAALMPAARGVLGPELLRVLRAEQADPKASRGASDELPGRVMRLPLRRLR